MRHPRFRVAALALACTLAGSSACGDDGNGDDGGDTAAEPGATADGPQVRFAAPADGEEVTSPLPLDMEAGGIEVVEAGDPRAGEGHLHVMVDVGCVEPGEVIPDDDAHVHYGDGGTVDRAFQLEPGEHDLCLQAADGAHTALDATDEITVTVTGP